MLLLIARVISCAGHTRFCSSRREILWS